MERQNVPIGIFLTAEEQEQMRHEQYANCFDVRAVRRVVARTID